MCNTILTPAEEAQQQGGFSFAAVVVIGSGMYGAFTSYTRIYERARRQPLERRPRVCCVLEAGPFLITEHFQNRHTDTEPILRIAGEDQLPSLMRISHF